MLKTYEEIYSCGINKKPLDMSFSFMNPTYLHNSVSKTHDSKWDTTKQFIMIVNGIIKKL